MNKSLLLSTVCAAVLLAGVPAQAQTVNYGGLQEMFGEAVTTSATGKPQRESEVPATMEIITADDIRRSGATNLPTILSRLSGVDVWNYGPTSSDVSIRGYSQPFSPRQLVLVNGRQVYLDDYGYTAWQTLPIDISEIRQIEVVKGPNTALFGFNAASGVINIITFNPLYDNVNEARATIGSQSYVDGAVVGTMHSKSNDFGLRLSAHGFSSSDFSSQYAYNNLAGYDPYKQAVNADALYQLTSNSQISAEASFVTQKQQETLPTLSTTYNTYNVGSAKLAYLVDSKWGAIQAQSYVNVADTQMDGLPATYGVLRFHNTVLVNQLSDLIKLNPKHTLRFSAEHRFNTLSVTPASTDADVSYNVLSVGGMWDWAISDSWSFTNALRFDHMMLNRHGSFPALSPQSNADWDRDINTISFNSGLVWKASANDTLRLTAARGIETPSLVQLGGLLINLTGAGIPAFYTGNPNLDPTVVTNYELGYDRKIEEINGKGSLRAFYQLNQDLILQPTSSPVSFDVAPGALRGLKYWVNGGRSSAVGIEAGLDGKFSQNWHWNANYTFMKIDDHLIASSAARSLAFEDGAPQHVFNGNLGWANDKWEVDGYVKFQTDFDAFKRNGTNAFGTTYGLGTVDSYWSVAARVGYKLTDDVTVALSGQQLNAESQETNGIARKEERRVYLSTSVKF